MALISTAGESGSFESAPAGTHLAICVGLYDIGIQPGEWQGKPIERPQIILRWELPEERNSNNEPMICQAWLTNSLGEKSNLRHWLEAWRGRAFTESELAGFDLRNILGRGCLVNLTERQNGGTKVSGVMALPKGMTIPTPYNPPVAFDADLHTNAERDALPKFIQGALAKRIRPQADTPSYQPGNDPESDIPF